MLGGAVYGCRCIAQTRIPRPCAFCANASPMSPNPTMPNVCPLGSKVVREVSSSGHARRSCRASSVFRSRAKAKISASTWSAMLVAWMPLKLVSTISLAASSGVMNASTPALVA